MLPPRVDQLNELLQICFETFSTSVHIFQCINGHKICGTCMERWRLQVKLDFKALIHYINQKVNYFFSKTVDVVCAVCQEPVIGRDFGFESFSDMLIQLSFDV